MPRWFGHVLKDSASSTDEFFRWRGHDRAKFCKRVVLVVLLTSDLEHSHDASVVKLIAIERFPILQGENMQSCDDRWRPVKRAKIYSRG